MREMTDFVKKIIRGFLIPLEGSRVLLNSSSMKKWALIPFVISLLVLLIGFFLVVQLTPDIVQWIVFQKMRWSGAGSEYLIYPAMFVTGLILVILNVYFSYWVVQIFAAPIYSLLAEKTAHQLNINPGPAGFALRIWTKLFLISLSKALIFSAVGIILFAFAFFIPVLNVFASALLFLVLATDSADYSLELAQVGWRDRFRFYRSHKAEFFGLAAFVGLTLIIPGLILLIMPAIVVGSSSFVFKRIEELRHDSRSYS